MQAESRTRRARRARAFWKAALAPGLLAALAVGAGTGGAAQAQVYAIALPDPTNKTLILRPETVPAGGEIEIVNAVQNKGSGPMTPASSTAPLPPALSIKFLLVRNVLDAGGTFAGGWGLDALERREVKRHSALWRVPATLAPATYFLCADVDPDDRVRESNEHNNRTCAPLKVEAAPDVADGGPDEPTDPPESPDGAESGAPGPGEGAGPRP